MSGHTDHAFQAMGCQSRVIVNGDDHEGLAAFAVERIESLEQAWSRFRADSEISALNRSPGQLLTVSPDTFTLVEHAIEGWRMTGGRFDPTLLDELVGHGYDRTHHELAPPASARPRSPGLGVGAGPAPGPVGVGDITMVPALPAVLVPPGLAFDPGGIGKGLGADLVAAEVMAQGATGVLIELGGDLRVAGEHPDHGPVWTVIANSGVPGHGAYRIGLRDGGVATSSQLARRWATAEGDRHHLLDPATGHPVRSDVAAVVVAGAATWRAEVVAKAALLAGLAAGRQLIVDRGCVGLLVDLDGEAHDAGLLQAAALI